MGGQTTSTGQRGLSRSRDVETPAGVMTSSSSALSLQACIGGYWASSPLCTCPLCKQQFHERPQLSVNRVFALIADNYKLTHYGAAGLPMNGDTKTVTNTNSTNPFVTVAAAAAAVWCDVCTGVKQPAVSSCLTCTASYCTEHVRPHEIVPFYSKHPLLDPQEALRGRTCAAHRRLLEASGNACCCHLHCLVTCTRSLYLWVQKESRRRVAASQKSIPKKSKTEFYNTNFYQRRKTLI